MQRDGGTSSDVPPPGDGRGGWSGDGLAHEAFAYDDEAQLLGRCLPFIAEGLDAGQPVLVVAGQGTLDVLERALSPLARGALARFEAAEGWWQGPHATMAAYGAAMRELREAGQPWRLVAEPVWLATPRGRYWSRFEAVANVAFADHPYYSLCLHDRRRLDHATVAEASCTHPLVGDSTGVAPSPWWSGADAYLSSVEPALLERPADVPAQDVASLPPVRRYVQAAAAEAGVEPARAADLVLAADELAANALAQADGVTVAAWTEGRDRLVVEIADDGPGFDDRLAGYLVPHPTRPGGRGLWIARALADELCIRSSPAGVTAQLHLQLATGR